MNSSDRIEALQRTLPGYGVDALLIEEPVDLFYLTGLEMSAGRLVVHSSGASLLVDGRYFEACSAKSSLSVLLWGEHSLKELLEKELKGVDRLGFDSEKSSFAAYSNLKKSLKSQLIPLVHPVKSLRAVKEKGEIALLREAASLAARGFDFVLGHLREGVSELELAAELEIFWKRSGGKKSSFDPIIAFGENSSMPHYRSGKSKLKRGQPVLIDIGVELGCYQSDMTRVVFFCEPDAKLKEIYRVVLQAQNRALELCREGITAGALDRAAREVIEEGGYGPLFPHSLGHGIGLEIHELPILSSKKPYAELPLKEGMVITIEPGIYLPRLGGVRIEDSIAVKREGFEDLTRRSKEPLVL